MGFSPNESRRVAELQDWSICTRRELLSLPTQARPTKAFISFSNPPLALSRLRTVSSPRPQTLSSSEEITSMQYSILFECAWAQPAALGAKIEKCLKDLAILAVIRFDITPLTKFEMPKVAPPATHNVVPAFPQDVLESRELLGRVVFCDHEWGQINTISMTIHHQAGRIETLAPLAPVNGKIDDGDLLKVQDNFDIALVELLGKVVTRAVFEQAMHGDTFGLDWDLFYHTLDSLLVADALDRYTKWVEKHGMANPAKRKLVVDEQVTRDWATRMVKRRSKKQK
ncbi:hypothetical protein B0H12DRAFT_1138415 [Mycena haematopus]|nr:hypothetical protein B0H12DRAFT_1138415 [Mycena haematopus]